MGHMSTRAYVRVVGLESVHHGLQVLVVHVKVGRVLLNSCIPLLEEERTATRRRHVQEKELATSQIIDLLHERRNTINQLGSKGVRVLIVERVSNTTH